MRLASSLKACVATLALVATATLAPWGARSWADAPCDNADIAPDTFIHQVWAASAVQCLVNAERTARNLAPLTRYVSMGKPGGPTMQSAWSVLGVATRQHADAAVQLRWWGEGANPHTNPQTHSTETSRASAAGYCKDHTLQIIRENTYTGASVMQDSSFPPFGRGDAVYTPRAAVRWWMWSKPHRETILNPNVQQIAVSVATGSADQRTGNATPAGTYVALFATCT
jgi:hypothetical protein